MEFTPLLTAALTLLIFGVAFLYSSVGHGGASGYLAVLSLVLVAPSSMSSTALILNILVAGIAFVTYLRAGYFSWRLTYPFAVTSVLFSLAGGMIHVSSRVYALLLGGALAIAAVRLAVQAGSARPADEPAATPPLALAAAAGAAIGLLSGIVGVGGGIFLSPLILLCGWSDPKHTAATSAFFIVVNSISGLAGRFIEGRLETGTLLPFLIAAAAGGVWGSASGARRYSSPVLQRILSGILLLAAAKLLLSSS